MIRFPQRREAGSKGDYIKKGRGIVMRGKTQPSKERHGSRLGPALPGKARPGRAEHGSRRGSARQGAAWLGKAWQGEAGTLELVYQAWHGFRMGAARHGSAWRGKAGQSMDHGQGVARHG